MICINKSGNVRNFRGMWLMKALIIPGYHVHGSMFGCEGKTNTPWELRESDKENCLLKDSLTWGRVLSSVTILEVSNSRCFFGETTLSILSRSLLLPQKPKKHYHLVPLQDLWLFKHQWEPWQSIDLYHYAFFKCWKLLLLPIVGVVICF